MFVGVFVGVNVGVKNDKKWAFSGLSPSVTPEPQAIGAMPGRAVALSASKLAVCSASLRESEWLHHFHP